MIRTIQTIMNARARTLIASPAIGISIDYVVYCLALRKAMIESGIPMHMQGMAKSTKMGTNTPSSELNSRPTIPRTIPTRNN